MRRSFYRWAMFVLTALSIVGCGSTAGQGGGANASSLTYASPVALASGSQAACSNLHYKSGSKARIAYMPPATEFDYYIAIGEGVKARAKELGASTFMQAPQSGNDINGQMGMIQDVISQSVDGIILSTHDEHAAAPLVKRAVDQGIAVEIVNSDIANFPSPVMAVVGYKQRIGTHKLGDYVIKNVGSKNMKVGILEGAPGYHSTERVGGFEDAVKGKSNFQIVASLDGIWNTRSEEHTSELQSLAYLVCRLLLEKKKR